VKFKRTEVRSNVVDRLLNVIVSVIEFGDGEADCGFSAWTVFAH
jgi:hypothetical protein